MAVLLTTPYMDEAARCARVGFMRLGRLIAEGTPAELRRPLDGRVIELRGKPLPLLRQEAEKLTGVEEVRAFGDKLHLRVNRGRAEAVIRGLKKAIPARGGSLSEVRPIPPTLEDVFISLLEQKA